MLGLCNLNAADRDIAGGTTLTSPTKKSFTQGETITVIGSYTAGLNIDANDVTIMFMSFNENWTNSTNAISTDVTFDPIARTFSGTIVIPNDFPLKQRTDGDEGTNIENCNQVIQVRINATNYANTLGCKIIAKTGESVAVASVTVAETASVSVGSTTTLTANVLPDNADNKSVTWSSDDEDVATVNAITGVVTGVAEGTANITVTTTEGGFTDECAVTVAGASESGELGDVILDIDWSNDTNTEAWEANTIYNATNMPSGFGLIGGSSDNMKIVNYGSSNGMKQNFTTANSAMWFTFNATGLTVGDKYSMETKIIAQNDKVNYTIYAWETSTPPADNYVADNNLYEVTNANALTTHIIEVEVTDPAMTFAIGSLKTAGNPQFYVKSWKIEKVADVPTDVENTEENTMNIYPNPAENILNVSGIEAGEKIEIYSAAGLLVISSVGNSIDVSNLCQGVYYVKASNEVKAFVKQ